MIILARFLIWLGYHAAKLHGERWDHSPCCCGYVSKRGRVMLTWEHSEVRNEKVFSIGVYRIYKNGYMEQTRGFYVSLTSENKWELYHWKSRRPKTEDTYVPHS